MKRKLPKIRSGFALLDVTTGRKALARLMPAGSYSLPAHERIPVVIRGYISHRHGADDGVSIEFGVDVESVEISEPAMPTGHKVKVGKVSSKALAKGKIAPADSTPAPLRKGKHAKAARQEKALRANREKARKA